MYVNQSEQGDAYFRRIGEHAQATDDLPDGQQAAQDQPMLTTEVNGEVHPVQEVESLCMNCHEQVSPASYPDSL